jgi:hypothetical protein
MNDTPRTNEQINGKPCTRFEILAGDSLRNASVQSEFARGLERELNATNDRIKRLEEQLMDAKNKHAVLVADVVLNEDRAERIKRLKEAGDYLCAAAAFMGWHDKIETWNKAKEAK